MNNTDFIDYLVKSYAVTALDAGTYYGISRQDKIKTELACAKRTLGLSDIKVQEWLNSLEPEYMSLHFIVYLMDTYKVPEWELGVYHAYAHGNLELVEQACIKRRGYTIYENVLDWLDTISAITCYHDNLNNDITKN